MSDRPKWMPTVDDVDRLAGGISELEPGISMQLYRAGLRAQIAVLEEMREHCRFELFDMSGYGVTESVVANKIGALRRELK